MIILFVNCSSFCPRMISDGIETIRRFPSNLWDGGDSKYTMGILVSAGQEDVPAPEPHHRMGREEQQ